MCERSEVWQDAGEQLAIQAEANEEAEATRQQLINKANTHLQQQSSSAPEVRDNLENYETRGELFYLVPKTTHPSSSSAYPWRCAHVDTFRQRRHCRSLASDTPTFARAGSHVDVIDAKEMGKGTVRVKIRPSPYDRCAHFLSPSLSLYMFLCRFSLEGLNNS